MTQQRRSGTSNQWVRKTVSIAAHSTLMCCDKDDITDAMLRDFEREELSNYKVYVTSVDDELLARWSGVKKPRSRRAF
jgi:hypothetical protein